MSDQSVSRRGSVICRLRNRHKWVQLQTQPEEAYQCLRCGERYFGKLEGGPDIRPFIGGGSIGP
jgi:hypothetical protein